MDIRELLLSHRASTGDSYSTIAHKTGLSKALIGRLMLPGYEHRVSQLIAVYRRLPDQLKPVAIAQIEALRRGGAQDG